MFFMAVYLFRYNLHQRQLYIFVLLNPNLGQSANIMKYRVTMKVEASDLERFLSKTWIDLQKLFNVFLMPCLSGVICNFSSSTALFGLTSQW